MLATSILDHISRAEHLPASPTVALQVFQLTRQDNVSTRELTRLIEQDPVFTAKILKMVNSALFSLPNRIASLPQAIVTLGLRTVKVLALYALVNKLAEDPNCKLDYKRYWKRSLTTAVSSRLLARRYDATLQDEAFVAGLLADLGVVAAMQLARREYAPVVEEFAAGNQPLQAVERRLLGITHADIGAALLSSWRLPDEVVHAVAHHHDEQVPVPSGERQRLAPIVWASALVADLFCQDLPSHELDSIIQHIVAQLNSVITPRPEPLDQDKLESVLLKVDVEVQQTASQIDVEIGETISYEELRMAAVNQLADLSVSAELDRAAASRMADAAQKQVETLNTEKQVLAREARTDGLTHIANRKDFDDHLARAVRECADKGQRLGLIMLDVDHFKRVNDTYGHLFGDEVLKVVGQVLGRVRSERRHVARFGGEEFTVTCPDSTLEELTRFANVLREAVQRLSVQYGTQKITVTASLGVACIDPTREELTAVRLIELADRALLAAKSAGRNQVRQAGN